VVVAAGLTEIEAPVWPVDQAYVIVPVLVVEAVNVEELPAQIVAGEAEADTVGSGFTVTVTVAVLVQPEALVPVTV
jgi:hypothetical protein